MHLPFLVPFLFLPSTFSQYSPPHLAPPSEGVAVHKKLTGRFIHLTDFHPDPFYKDGASEEGSCHSSKPEKGRRAGYWGLPVSECDAPFTLVNATFSWLSTHFKDKVDFVVWTGDNARHDIDSRVPRSMKEIFNLNRMMLDKIRETFGKDVKIVASIGNNDIYPHNIMLRGPSAITTGFLEYVSSPLPPLARPANPSSPHLFSPSIWSDLIPEDQTHNFARGGYYSIEAVPSRLLLISLNTLYMYDSNKAVDGCPDISSHVNAKDEIDPGTEELMWLEQQLELARSKGMQVWLTGHVPPTKGNWYGGCYRKYGELMLRFQDSVVGNLFGHMNEDHFSLIDSRDVLSSSKRQLSVSSSSPISIFGRAPSDLREDYQDLPGPKKIKERDFAIVNVNPSVIPTYLPAVRVWMYNVTGEAWKQNSEDLEEDDEEEEEEERSEALSTLYRSWTSTSTSSYLQSFLSLSSSTTTPASYFLNLWDATIPDPFKSKKDKKNKKKKKKKKAPKPKPRHSSPLSPSRTNRFLSPLGYTQYYLDLERANLNDGFGPDSSRFTMGKNNNKTEEKRKERPSPQFEIEYMTFGAEKLAREILGCGDQESSIPRELLPPRILLALDMLDRDLVPGKELDERELERKVVELAKILKEEKEGELVPYGFEDLTIGSWIKLARRLGEDKQEWKGYKRRMYVSSGAKE